MSFRLEYQTTAKCKPEHVWKKFEKLEQWSWWLPLIGQTKWVQGQPWQKGSRFSMELVRPVHKTLQPVILEAAPPHKLVWVGSSMGFRGEHRFAFEEQPDGSTLLKTWEDSSGFLTSLMSAKLKDDLLNMHKEWLESLKAEAEKIAREEFARS